MSGTGRRKGNRKTAAAIALALFLVVCGATGAHANEGGKIFDDGSYTTGYYGTESSESDTPSASGATVYIDNLYAIENGVIVGGYSSSDEVKDNEVIINDTNPEHSSSGSIYGGWSEKGSDVTSNTVTIIAGTIKSKDIIGGYVTASSNSAVSSYATANYNTVTISGGSFSAEDSIRISGAYSYAYATSSLYSATAIATATDNTVTISGGTFSADVTIYGGSATAIATSSLYRVTAIAIATDNTVTISGGTFSADVTIYGGSATATATEILGSFTTATAAASNNTVTISGGTFSADVTIYGGSATATTRYGTGTATVTATNNTVTISGGSFTGNVKLYGGYSESETSYEEVISDNTLNISSRATFSGTATAYNFATIAFAESGNYSLGVSTAGTFTDGGAGVTTTLDVGSNDVTLAGDIANGADTTTLNITKTGTGTLTLSGTNTYTGTTTVEAGTLSIVKVGALSGDSTSTYGTYAVNSGATLDFAFTEDGTVNNDISGAGNVSITAGEGKTVTFAGEKTYEGWTYIYSGTLDASATPLSSTSLYMAGSTTFVAPANDSAGNTYTLASLVVNASNGSSASYKGTLTMAGDGGTLDFHGPAKANSTALLVVDGSATLDGVSYSYTATGAVSLLETGDRIRLVSASRGLSAVGTTGTYNVMTGTTIVYDLTEEILTADGEFNLVVVGVGAAPQAKALLEGTLAGSVLVAQGADLVAGRGMEAAMNATRGTDGFAVTPFAAVQGGSMRYNSGSHIDMQSLNLMAGLAAGFNMAAGDLTTGAFFEYGNGSYSTYNSFNTGSFDGNGNTYFVGWGLLGRMDFLDMGPGHVYVEASGRMGGLYNSYENQDMRDYVGRVADYDRYNAYYGFHAGAGYVFDFTEAAHLDVHGKYFWTRVDGEELTLSTGEALDFEDVTSSRLRFGTRFTFDVNEKVRPYIGVAYEHEFDGRARGTTYGYDISSPSLKGDTGIGELGISLAPEELPITLDFTVQGYVGKREGVTGSMFFKYAF